MTERRFVITRPEPSSGLGCNLLSMVGALYLCERAGRNLIVDWTNMSELRNPQLNYFVTFFEPIRRWRDVEIFYVNDPDSESDGIRYDARETFRPGYGQYRTLLDGHGDSRNVLLQPFHYRLFDQSGLTTADVFHYTREFYHRLTPRAHLRARLASLQARFEDRIVVGLNMRTGNGQFSEGAYRNRVNMSIFTRQRFLERLRRACDDCCAAFPEWLAADRAIYVVTDCQSMQDRLLRLSGAFAVRSRFPPPGMGHQFADFGGPEYSGYSDVDSVDETIIDMFLLARCRGLVCNYTEYNRYAQYTTTFFNGNLRNIERYFESPFRRAGRWVKHRTFLRKLR